MEIIEALYFILPAYVANMVPVLVHHISWGKEPIDAGEKLGGRRIFGSHKTWRGMISGTAAAVITIFLQRLAGSYENIPLGMLAVMGFLLGAGALVGDLVKSFFKRRLGIAPGRPWILFDQLDFVIGALAAVSLVYVPPFSHIVIIFLATPLLHLLANCAAFVVGLKKTWW